MHSPPRFLARRRMSARVDFLIADKGIGLPQKNPSDPLSKSLSSASVPLTHALLACFFTPRKPLKVEADLRC